MKHLDGVGKGAAECFVYAGLIFEIIKLHIQGTLEFLFLWLLSKSLVILSFQLLWPVGGYCRLSV